MNTCKEYIGKGRPSYGQKEKVFSQLGMVNVYFLCIVGLNKSLLGLVA